MRGHPRRRTAWCLAVTLVACGPAGPASPGGGTTRTADAAMDREVEVREIAYGDHPEQVADLHLPTGAAPAAGWPVVVLIHGGFWRQRFTRDLMTPLAEDLTDRGVAAWNVEYRRVGGDGGWPTTLTDAAAAVDHLEALVAEDAPLDLDRVVVAGHSAGGHLALWVAGRSVLGDDAPGSSPRVTPCLAVGQAPVADLEAAQGLGDGAVVDLLGGRPDEVRERYVQADPVRLVGHGVEVLLVHGEDDAIVPVEQSRRYASAAEVAGDEVEVVVLPGDHFVVIDPTDATWQAVLDAVERTC